MSEPMRWTYDDGGRAAAGFVGDAGDCVVRAIAIAAQRPYREVYDDLFTATREWATTNRSRLAKRVAVRGNYSPRNGVHKPVINKYLAALGWGWTPTMRIGSGTTVHLAQGELPDGRLIVSVSRHMVAVVNGLVRDTHDPTRDGLRCVYGYWQGKESE